MKQWVIYRGFAKLGLRFRADASALGAPAWRVWRNWMIGGFLASAAVMILLVLLGQTLDSRGMAEWDRYWSTWFTVNEVMGEHDAIWFQTFGSSAMQLPALALAATIAIILRHPMIAATILVVRAMEVPLVMIGWYSWDRPRPVVVEAAIAVATQSGFPSGHTANVICFYGFLAWLWARRSASLTERAFIVLLMAALVTVVAASRLGQSMHYPSDIIAGALIGSFWLTMGILAVKQAESHIPDPNPIEQPQGAAVSPPS